MQIQNDQCQELDQAADTKWLKVTSQGEWATHTVRLKVHLKSIDFLKLIFRMEDKAMRKTSTCVHTPLIVFSVLQGLSPHNTHQGKSL